MSEPKVVISAALGAWLALRRLDRGRVTLECGVFFDDDRAVPGYLVAPFRLCSTAATRGLTCRACT